MDPPHLIMTYTALLTLAILRDDCTRLDRRGLKGLLRATQQEDGRCVQSLTSLSNHFVVSFPLNQSLTFINLLNSTRFTRHHTCTLCCPLSDECSFTAIPGQGEADLRMVYTAFAICAMLDDWSAVDVPRALGFIKRCMVRHAFPGSCIIATF